MKLGAILSVMGPTMESPRGLAEQARMLVDEGYAPSFEALLEETDWDSYGTGRNPKCANCMAHCGYEPTAAHMAVTNPLKALWVALRGVRTDGPMAPEIVLDGQRPAQYVFSDQVEKKLSEIRTAETRERMAKTTTNAA